MIGDKTKQILRILKWQALVVQCRGIFYEFLCSGKDFVKAFNFHVQMTKNVKNVIKNL